MNELINLLINNDNMCVLKSHSPWLLFSNTISYWHSDVQKSKPPGQLHHWSAHTELQTGHTWLRT